LRLASDARALAEKYVGAKSVAAAMASVFLALPRYERGDTSSAEIAVLDDLNIIETTGFHESFLSAFIVLVRAAICRGDKELARALLNRAERVAAGRGWDRVVSALVVERVRLCEPKAHDVRAAANQLHALCGKHPAPERSSWTDIHINAAIVDGFLARVENRTEDALHRFAWAYDELLATDNRHGALRAGLDLANVAFLSGSRVRAFEVLNQVLSWAAKAGAVSFVWERPREFRDLLIAAQKNLGAEHRAFLEQLLRTDHAQSGPAGTHAGAPKPKPVLTERERSIVEFIAEGQSNKQIARTLGVTPETVKTHVKRVFIKLSAETRAQAVVRAQSLGVLRRLQAN